jgi:hypothetical protein
MLRRLAAFLALFALAPATAEAQTRTSYPSLAKRPAESRDRTAPAPRPVEPAAADSALSAEVATLGRQLESGEAAFRQQIAQGRSAVSAASSAGPNSEAWVSAQMAISMLDSARYDSVAAMAGLDTLYISRQDSTDAARVTADLATIEPVRTRALATVDAQNDALDALRKALRQP